MKEEEERCLLFHTHTHTYVSQTGLPYLQLQVWSKEAIDCPHNVLKGLNPPLRTYSTDFLAHYTHTHTHLPSSVTVKVSESSEEMKETVPTCLAFSPTVPQSAMPSRLRQA